MSTELLDLWMTAGRGNVDLLFYLWRMFLAHRKRWLNQQLKPQRFPKHRQWCLVPDLSALFTERRGDLADLRNLTVWWWKSQPDKPGEWEEIREAARPSWRNMECAGTVPPLNQHSWAPSSWEVWTLHKIATSFSKSTWTRTAWNYPDVNKSLPILVLQA